MSKKRTSNQIGRDWEERFAKETGAKLQPSSGSRWYARMDSKIKAILFSLKATDEEHLRLSDETVREVRDAARQPGGEYATPGLAVSTKIGDFVIFELSDFTRLLAEIGWYVDEKQVAREQRRNPKVLRWNDPDTF